MNLLPTNSFRCGCPCFLAVGPQPLGTQRYGRSDPIPSGTSGGIFLHATPKGYKNVPQNRLPNPAAPPLSSQTSPRVKAQSQQPNRLPGGRTAQAERGPPSTQTIPPARAVATTPAATTTYLLPPDYQPPSRRRRDASRA